MPVTELKKRAVVEEVPVEELIFEYPDSHLDITEYELSRERELQAKRKIKDLTRRRSFEAVICVGLILAVGFFIFLLIYPQMELSEMSRDNSDLKDEIAVLKKQILDSEEDVNGITDMDNVRAQALALGMQDPNSNQVVYIPMPADDKLVTVVSYDAYGVSNEAYRNAVDNLAEYYMENGSRGE